ncbi:MAG TPA: glycosyltransferase family 1 protein [Wenzhouxiangellaceae bacterium]|nr:glycosyltransferase family 1 protein [Wenzhouxiangellaceae bacterium]
MADAESMYLNARILHQPLTGVGRYLSEVLAAWPGATPMRLDPPRWASQGLKGHGWEQLVLPARVGRNLLWSPVHSGPLAVRNQVVTVHDLVPLDHPEWLNRGFARWYGFMLPRLVRRARHVIAISEFTRRRLVETTGLAEDDVTVIHNGVGTRFRPPATAARRAMRESLGLADNRYLLSVGTLEPRKNLPGLLHAWRQALPRLPGDLELVIAGAPGRASVFADARLDDLPPRVRLVGRVDDDMLPSLYAEAEWFVYLSLYEGFGLPPLEALACGTPVIVSDIPVFREVTADASIAVDPQATGAVADALVQAVEDSASRKILAERGLRQAEKFDWRETARRTREVLERFG